MCPRRARSNSKLNHMLRPACRQAGNMVTPRAHASATASAQRKTEMVLCVFSFLPTTCLPVGGRQVLCLPPIFLVKRKRTFLFCSLLTSSQMRRFRRRTLLVSSDHFHYFNRCEVFVFTRLFPVQV